MPFQDLVWDSADSDATPHISVETVGVGSYEADPVLAQEVERAYSILDPLLKTDLTIIPQVWSLSSFKVSRQV